MGWLPLAAAEAPPWLAEVAGLVGGAAAVAYVAFRAGLVPIVGFLLAGVLIGLNQLAIIADRWGHCFPDDLRLEPVRSPA